MKQYIRKLNDVMEKIKIDLKNCYGIKSLDHEFNFSKSKAYAIYAPNGVMKSSLARTFQDLADRLDSKDRIFKNRNTTRTIIDETGLEIDGSSILVVIPYNSQISVTEKTSTLLLDQKLKKEYDALLHATSIARAALINEIAKTSGSKKNIVNEISLAFTQSEGNFDKALMRIKREVQELKDPIFSKVKYDIIFNEKVIEALNSKNLKSLISDYIHRYNTLLSESIYFRKGTFDYYNAGQIAKSLNANGFFKAKHTIKLNAQSGNKEIESEKELEEVISKEKENILADSALRKTFDDVSVQLNKNAELRAFANYIQQEEALLSRMDNLEKLKQDILLDYIKIHESLYLDWTEKFDKSATRLAALEIEAQSQTSQWEEVITIFNERFAVPFKLEAINKAELILGKTSIIEIGFTYIDGNDSTKLNKDDLLKSLSTGEQRALYLLNIIFEIETRKKALQNTILIIDDVADSFDYQNKYAIVQYLKEISENDFFKMIIMTHNFDFFRTIQSRFVVNYQQCLMAHKTESEIKLVRADGIKNIFKNDWKIKFFSDDKKKIASIPFFRNLIEMTVGENNTNYRTLTSMLHWMQNTYQLKVNDLDKIYNEICEDNSSSYNQDKLVYQLIFEQAEDCSNDTISLENKIVLSIAIRLMTEKFMISKIDDAAFVESIDSDQTGNLAKKFKEKYANMKDCISTIDQVVLMTPENIHINSFMYEPIIDMSSVHLQKLYGKVKAL